jgi:hypothetical protein
LVLLLALGVTAAACGRLSFIWWRLESTLPLTDRAEAGVLALPLDLDEDDVQGYSDGDN